MALKRYADWKGSLNDFLQVNDLVDEEIQNHFINVMPPVTFNSQLVQLGEPYSHVGDRAIYPTLKKTPEGWVYAGNCFRGSAEHVGSRK